MGHQGKWIRLLPMVILGLLLGTIMPVQAQGVEQLATSVLEADALHVANAVIAALAIGIVLLVFFGSRAINGILASNAATLNANTALTNTIVRQTSIMEGVQRALENQVAATMQTREAIRVNEEKAETRYKTIIERIEGVTQSQVQHFEKATTDLVGAVGGMMVDSIEMIVEAVAEAVQPLQTDLGIIRTGIEQVQERRKEEDERYQADVNSIWDKVAATQQKLNQTVKETIINVLGGSNGNTQQGPVVSKPDTLPDVGAVESSAGTGNDSGASADAADRDTAGDSSASGSDTRQ